MKRVFLMTLLAGLAPSLAHASPVLNDTFDGENGGTGALNYTGLTNFVLSGGSVDLIESGQYGIGCAGATGACIDLDGSTGSGGTLVTRNPVSFNAGDIVTISALISGNQRGSNKAADDRIAIGFQSGAIFFGNVYGPLAFDAPFATYTFSFVAPDAGNTYGVVGTFSNDQMGPILDNVAIDVSAPTAGSVPEPASWAMMVAGFGLVGGAARRPRRVPA